MKTFKQKLDDKIMESAGRMSRNDGGMFGSNVSRAAVLQFIANAMHAGAGIALMLSATEHADLSACGKPMGKFRRRVLAEWEKQGQNAGSGEIAKALKANETKVSEAMTWLIINDLEPATNRYSV